MNEKRKLIGGTRASLLAKTQSGQIVARLREKLPRVKITLKEVHTTGDADRKTPLTAFGGEGVFVKELEKSLKEQSIDFAIHSLKDVPHTLPEGLVLACFPPREDPADYLVTRGAGLAELPEGALVGTGSPRRVLQLRARRPDLRFADLRGNVETRLAKVTDGELDAVVLACAGMKRLGMELPPGERLDPSEFLPAIGQGILALEIRSEDDETAEMLRSVQDSDTAKAARAERLFMELSGGGCKMPMAAWARMEHKKLVMTALLGDPRSGEMVRAELSEDPFSRETLAERMVETLEKLCSKKGMPMPRDLPEGWLLSGGPLS